MRAILDSGPLIAAWNAKDEHHRWARRIFQKYSGPFHVTEPILTEVAHLTGRDRMIIEGVRSGRFILESGFQNVEHIERLLEQFEHCDLADATVVGLSDRLRRLNVLSTDRRHFVTYRRSDGSALPMVFPD
jgi:predicted nucleic acid-binding protein